VYKRLSRIHDELLKSFKKRGTVKPRRWLRDIVCGLLATIFLPQGINAAQYMIDTARSQLVVQLFKTGVGAAFAHDHVVRASKFSGQIDLDPNAPTAAQIAVDVDATALVVDEPEIRKKYNLPLGLSEESRQEIQQTLESESQLYVRRHSNIRFRSSRVTLVKEGQYNVIGELELRGVTQVVSLFVQAELQKEVLRGRGSSRFLQSNFGYQPYSAFWGAVRNQDEVVLHVDIVAVLQ
jgi:polyisoprenoid-binding protein YceI